MSPNTLAEVGVLRGGRGGDALAGHLGDTADGSSAAPILRIAGVRTIPEFGVGLAWQSVDAFLLRMTLIPALMHLIGRPNWALPKVRRSGDG